MKQLVENYQLPKDEDTRSILKESQLKHILEDDKPRQKRRKTNK